MAGCGRLGFGSDAVAIVTPSIAVTTECGVAPTPSEIEITNDGTTALVVQRVEATGGFRVTDKLPFTVEPGATRTLSVMPPAAVIGTDVSGSIKAGTLTLYTNDSEEPAHEINLEARVVGAQIAFDTGGGVSMPVTLTFSATNACPLFQGVTIHNKGDRPATLSLTAPSSFVVSNAFAGTLDAGQSGSFQVRVLTSGPCTGSEAISYAVTGSVCSSIPAVLDATFAITGATSCSCS